MHSSIVLDDALASQGRCKHGIAQNLRHRLGLAKLCAVAQLSAWLARTHHRELLTTFATDLSHGQALIPPLVMQKMHPADAVLRFQFTGRLRR